jgi:hypothetical protein
MNNSEATAVAIDVDKLVRLDLGLWTISAGGIHRR